MVPFFIWSAYRDREGAATLALVLFLVASLSDFVDGYLARKHDMITRMGQFLDPTADKLLVGAALVVLVDLRDFPLWAALVIAIRELAVQILRTEIVRGGGTLPASAGGKLKTLLQVTLISLWLATTDVGIVHWALLAAALLMTVTSAWSYFREALTGRARVET